MGILDRVFDVLQKPQGVVTGAFAGLGNQVGRAVNPGAQEDEVELTNIFRELDDAGVDTSEWEHLRPRAQSVWSGIKEGWNNDVSPGKIMDQGRSVEEWENTPGVGQRILGTAADITMDPLAAVGATGAVGRLAGKIPAAGKFAQGAQTFGNMGESATALGKAGQYARRGIQGVVGSAALGGGSLDAVGLAGLIGVGEKGLAKAAGTRLASRMGGQISQGVIGPLQDKVRHRFSEAAGNPPGEPGQLFGDGRFNLGAAEVEGAGAASRAMPMELRNELLGRSNVPPSDGLETLFNRSRPVAGDEALSRSLPSVTRDMGLDLPALPRAGTTSQGVSPANPIPLGPAGSTGAPRLSMEEALQILMEMSRGRR